MGIWLDIIFVLIVLLCVVLAAKKGFVKSFVEVIGYVLAVVIAFSFSGTVADFVYDSFVEAPFNTAIENAVNENADTAIEALPDYLVNLLDKANVDLNALLTAENSSGKNIAEQVSGAIEPIALSVFKTIVTIIIFAVVLLIARLLSGMLNSLFKGVILGTLNKTLGGALGLIKGLALAVIFCLASNFIASISSEGFLIFTKDAIDGTFICKQIISLIVGNF